MISSSSEILKGCIIFLVIASIPILLLTITLRIASRILNGKNKKV